VPLGHVTGTCIIVEARHLFIEVLNGTSLLVKLSYQRACYAANDYKQNKADDEADFDDVAYAFSVKVIK